MLEQPFLEEAIRLAGGVKAVADKLGVSVQSVYQWRKFGLPAGKSLELSELTLPANKGVDVIDLLREINSNIS